MITAKNVIKKKKKNGNKHPHPTHHLNILVSFYLFPASFYSRLESGLLHFFFLNMTLFQNHFKSI